MIDKNVLEKVNAYIDEHKDDIIADLMDVSSIRSVTDATSDVKPFGQECIDVLEHMLKKGADAGFETHNYENYIGTITLNVNAEKDLGSWAHLDVVPEGELSEWMADPYKPYIKDGYIFGRGVSDNKSGVIGTFWIQRCFKDLQLPLNHNIKLFCGTNEEKGMADVEYYVANYPCPQFSLVPDAGFPGACGEFGRLQFDLVADKALSSDFVDIFAGSVFNAIPNKATAILAKDTNIDLSSLPEDFTVTNTDNGIEIVAPGVASHAAFPEGGVNAIYKLTKALAACKGIKAEDKAILDFLTGVNTDSYGTYLGFAMTDEISGQTISSGTVLRNNNGYVKLTNDCRYCVTEDGEFIIKSIKDKCAQNNFHLEIAGHDKPSFIDKNSIGVQTCQKVIKSHLNLNRDITIGKGGTYAGKIPNALATGINTTPHDAKLPDYVKPGHGHAHAPDECMNIAGYIDGIKLIAEVFLELDENLK